ncbi:hypothetical protein HC931_03555 [Candidatus Gracilibacteria bacterium]|nr:hypothetical protein [Candidatus Gracilibacteria bacterium]NJM87830.1 hypothetical protein [Hydrococcus sp. RU_2_2]NJP18616.1 hypothetical protein [Hydrococcus sp. CRU_1_1]NJQ97784.1 hypothetical protein [Hydrococcus sp. CSU_1_8]
MAKIDTDLQELKSFIGEQFGQVNKRLDAMDAEIGEQFGQVNKRLDVMDVEIKEIRLAQAKIEGRLEEWKPSINKISDLAEKVGELKNWRQIALVVITGTFGSLFGWFLRGGK